MTRIPRSALILGLAGLLPFWAPVLIARLSVNAGRSPAAEALIWTLYAGLILSFLGGVRWGAEINRNNPPRTGVLTASILPSIAALIAGIAHWAGSPIAGWLLLAISLTAMLFWDRLSIREGELPDWYDGLRLILTAGAVLSAFAMMLVRMSA